MGKKEVATFVFTSLFVCGIALLAICRDSLLEWATVKGYSLVTIFTNAILIIAIITVLVFNFLITSNQKNNKQQIIINKLQSDIDEVNRSITSTIANNRKTLAEKTASLNKLVAQKQKMIKELSIKIEETTKERDEHNSNIDKFNFSL